MSSNGNRGKLLAASSFFLVLLLVLPLDARNLPGQESMLDPLAQGLQLYREGKVKEAVGVLKSATKRQKANPDAWHYLGLAQFKIGDVKSATKSFQQAIKLRPDFAPSRISLAILLLRAGKLRDAAREAEQARTIDSQSKDAHYVVAEVRLSEGAPEDALKAVDTALRIDNRFQEAWLLKSYAWLGLFRKETLEQQGKSDSELPSEQRYEHYKHLGDAADSLETYLKLNQNAAENAFWREQLDAMRFYKKWAADRQANSQVQPMKSSLRPTITYRERAQYTPEARAMGVSGIVLLMAAYWNDGQLRHILVLQGLSYGLTQQAVTAARKIRFTPAMKDGKPVSVVGRIEFNFNLY